MKKKRHRIDHCENEKKTPHTKLNEVWRSIFYAVRATIIEKLFSFRYDRQSLSLNKIVH